MSVLRRRTLSFRRRDELCGCVDCRCWLASRESGGLAGTGAGWDPRLAAAACNDDGGGSVAAESVNAQRSGLNAQCSMLNQCWRMPFRTPGRHTHFLMRSLSSRLGSRCTLLLLTTPTRRRQRRSSGLVARLAEGGDGGLGNEGCGMTDGELCSPSSRVKQAWGRHADLKLQRSTGRSLRPSGALCFFPSPQISNCAMRAHRRELICLPTLVPGGCDVGREMADAVETLL